VELGLLLLLLLMVLGLLLLMELLEERVDAVELLALLHGLELGKLGLLVGQRVENGRERVGRVKRAVARERGQHCGGGEASERRNGGRGLDVDAEPHLGQQMAGA
jgi:hypothetical protein